jgi:uncharacterized protein (DUF1501 family)
MKTIHPSRRRFLQHAGHFSLAGVAAPFAMNLAGIGAAAAQSATDYRALVCVFMRGANDHNNTVITFDPDSFNAYYAARPSIARNLDDCIGPAGESLELVPRTPLTGSNAGRKFALPKELAPLKPMWDAGQLAVLANVGTLVAPITKTQYQNMSVPVPVRLFSHNDQQAAWQANSARGEYLDGWGGRLGDLFASQNTSPVFTANSVAGNALWLDGETVATYQVSTQGSVHINTLQGNLFGSSTAAAAFKQLITTGGDSAMTQDLATITQRSIDADAKLSAALAAAPDLPLPLGTAANSLSAQLRTVARMIASRQTLGNKRQVFFVAFGNFDTHDNQLIDQPSLHTQLAAGLSYFQSAMQSLSVADQVTTFTASDFGRTLTSNGDGSDHAWGAHHFILGGAVLGQQYYGKFPIMGLNNNDEVGSGRTIPTTSVDQYAATLARWFGVSASDMGLVLPNLGAFSAPNLGFMG